MVLVIHADAEVTWHARFRASAQAEVTNSQAQVEKSKMKAPVNKTPDHVRHTMRSRVKKGLAALTALGTP